LSEHHEKLDYKALYEELRDWAEANHWLDEALRAIR